MPYPVLPTPRKRSTLRALGVTALVTAVIAVTSAPALAIVTPTSTGTTLANALAGPGANVTGASLIAHPQANGTIDTLGGFPTHGSNFAV